MPRVGKNSSAISSSFSSVFERIASRRVGGPVEHVDLDVVAVEHESGETLGLELIVGALSREQHSVKVMLFILDFLVPSP